MEQEIWKDIPGYEGLYQVSNIGNVKSLKGGKRNTLKEKYLKHLRQNNGYLYTQLSKNKIIKTISIHRLVAITFIPNPENKPQVNHIDGNKINNNISNLEWCTASENGLHSYRVLGNKGYYQNNHPMKGKFGINHNGSKKINQYDLEGNFIKTWDSGMDIQRELKIFRSGVSICCKGKIKTSGGFIWRYY